jgi:hypothetical protein
MVFIRQISQELILRYLIILIPIQFRQQRFQLLPVDQLQRLHQLFLLQETTAVDVKVLEGSN